MPYLVGYVRTEQDANICFQAAREGRIPLTTKRLTSDQRKEIAPQQIYLYDEMESDIRRWTDGRQWCDSYASGEFLVYKEANVVTRKDKKCKEERRNGLRKRIIADKMPGSNLRLVCYSDASTSDVRRQNHNQQVEKFRVTAKTIEAPIIGGLHDGFEQSGEIQPFSRSPSMYGHPYPAAHPGAHPMRSHSFEYGAPFMRQPSLQGVPPSHQSFGGVPHPAQGYPFSYNGSLSFDSAMMHQQRVQHERPTFQVAPGRNNSGTSFRVPSMHMGRSSIASQENVELSPVPTSIGGTENFSMMLESFPHGGDSVPISTVAADETASPILSGSEVKPFGGAPIMQGTEIQAFQSFEEEPHSPERSAFDSYLHKQGSMSGRIQKTGGQRTSPIMENIRKHDPNMERMPSLVSLDGNEEVVIDGRVPQSW